MTMQAKRARLMLAFRRQWKAQLSACSYIAFGFLIEFSLVGCSMLSPRDSSLKEYNDAKRSIENPTGYGDGITRPEGRSAEKSGSAKRFWNDLA